MKLFKNKKAVISVVASMFLIAFLSAKTNHENKPQDIEILSYIVDPKKQNIKFFWKDEAGENYGNFLSLKKEIEAKGGKLIFATNGGMYDEKHQPNGLYIENGLLVTPINQIQKGYGNFYLLPNGVFYLEKNGRASITPTTDLKELKHISYATQSGPMLVIGGKIHSQFKKGSKHKNIRNGVGILPDGKILFAMSKEKVNFYDFASYFKKKACKNALYLDGFVSKTYLPLKNWEQTDGDLGVIIGIVE